MNNEYRIAKASELPTKEQDRLRNALQHDLTEALIRSVKANPPQVNLADIEVLLRPGQDAATFKVADDCGTCVTCETCATCATCVTSSAAADIPVGVVRELGLASKPQVETRKLLESLERVKAHLERIDLSRRQDV